MDGVKIATAAGTKEIIRRHAFQIKKSLGQNFLVDQHVLQKILSAAQLSKDDFVIEIGPGLGGLTQELASRAGHVTAIEIDSRLIPILTDNLKEHENIDIINRDVLQLDLGEVIRASGYQSAKIAANLPYYITTPIIMDLLEKRLPVQSITVMIQREVAERIASKPSTREYGALTLAVQYYAEPYLVANVPSHCFIPRPAVDSAVIRLTPLKEPPVSVRDEAFLFGVVKAAFSMRRKTLLNCLYGWGEITWSKERLKEMLISLGFNENVRGETLGMESFALIADALFDAQGVSKSIFTAE